MIIHEDIVQGTPEWAALRAGIPTASAFDNLVTPKRKKTTGERRERYMYHLLAERIMRAPIVEFTSRWMDRGSAAEAEAVAYYEAQRDLDSVKVGFVTNDAGTVGASPDRLVGEVGLLEIKVPKPGTHAQYLMKASIDAEYYVQAQGQLWVCERVWNDVMSYSPEGMPEALIRVERDREMIEMLENEVGQFSRELEALVNAARERGYIKDAAGKVEQPFDDPFGLNVSAEDIADDIMQRNEARDAATR